MKKKVESVDPTLPFIEITLDGKAYKMCLDHGALCEAEAKLIGQHPEVNLLYTLGSFSGSKSRIIFAMSLQKFHPELAYEDALKLVNNRNAILVAGKVVGVYEESNPEGPAEPAGPQ